MIEKIAAEISRSMFVVPGGYFVAKALRTIFSKSYSHQEWREFTFREIKMKVDVSKQMGSTIYWRGAHDWAPIFALEKLVQSGQCLIDVGANQGEYTLWAARKIGPKGKVYSFEPLSTMYYQLQKNIRINKGFDSFIKAIPLGLSDKPGNLKLFSSDLYNEGVNTLFPSTSETTFLEEITLNTLDNEVSRLGISQLDFIKIDVEGAELFVLRGAIETLKKFKPILFLELNETACQTAGYSTTDIFGLLEQLGYNRFELIGLRGKTSSLKKEQLPEFCNIIAKP